MSETPLECYPCAMNALVGDLPPRESIVVETGWRLAHAFNSTPSDPDGKSRG